MTFSFPPTRPTRPPPATGRVGFVSAYFHLNGILAAVATGLIAAGIAFPQHITWPHPPTSKLLELASAAMFTFGLFRTSWLLDRRRKTGASLALLCFAIPLARYFSGATTGRLSIAIASFGILLVASVWRRLE